MNVGRASNEVRMVTDTMGELGVENEDKDEDDDYIVNDETQRTYLRGRFLGQGAHAMVYLVTDLTDNSKKEYAMKIMNIENPLEKGTRMSHYKGRNREVRLSQVTKEVDIHNLMKHKNVVKLETYFQKDLKFYMVLEHCEMNNLAQLLRTYKRFSENETRNFLKQLLAGLQHIHDHGIIHRDLKPANIYITQDMVLKIGDFGLADRVRSKSRGICGTPNYISPEVLNEQGYTTAVDIWAVGCITYHMITGRPPFEADNQAATYDLIRTHRYSPISPSQAGAALRHLINWMLAFRPEDRPSIPFIFGHTWMKRGQRQSRTGTSWLRYHKKRRDGSKTIPLADLHSEESTHSNSVRYQVSKESGEKGSYRKEIPLWKNILERAKSHTKVLSYEDMSNLSVFHHLKSKMYFSVSSKSKEPFKKAIEEVLRGIPRCSDRYEFIPPEDYPLPVFISKWIDYSNKYGFGYELTDGTCGVFFSDISQISLDGTKTCVTWSNKGRRATYPIHSVPNQLQEKVELLHYFVEYMDTNLSSGALDSREHVQGSAFPALIRQWMRNDKVILFELMDGSMQINFFQDHCKFILYEESTKVDRQVMLLTVDEGKNIKCYNLTKMGRSGCPEDIITHLIHIHSLL